MNRLIVSLRKCIKCATGAVTDFGQHRVKVRPGQSEATSVRVGATSPADSGNLATPQDLWAELVSSNHASSCAHPGRARMTFYFGLHYVRYKTACIRANLAWRLPRHMLYKAPCAFVLE